MLASRVEIPSGLTTPRMIAGIPLEAGGLLVMIVAFPWVLFHTLWTLLLVIPLWSFMRWNARKDPLFLKLWAGQLVFKKYYHHG